MKKNVSKLFANWKINWRVMCAIVAAIALALIVIININGKDNRVSYNDTVPSYKKDNIVSYEDIVSPYDFLSYNQSEFIYLSDIPYIAEKTLASQGSIVLDKNDNENINYGLITLNVNAQKQYFIKGILTYTNSTLIYDLSDYDYDYFTSYIGVDESYENLENGVKFSIYTSNDGELWDLEKLELDEILKEKDEALFIKINIKDRKYLKLSCDNNENETKIPAVYADAKLVKEDYVEESISSDFIKPLEEYDEIIKNYYGSEIDEHYELTLLQREFVNNFGYDMLMLYTSKSSEYKEVVYFLMNNLDNLKLYIMGGKPTGSYIYSLKVLTELYREYKNDFDINEVTKYGTTLGDLYKKMAITLSLTHSDKVALWMNTDDSENKSDAKKRYEIFKKLHSEGKFVLNDNLDITEWFEKYTVEEMRFVLNSMIDDESILWLNEYTQKQIDENSTQVWNYLTPHPYMKLCPNYDNQEFHDESKKEYWDELFGGVFSKYGLAYSTNEKKVYKLWMNFVNEFNTEAVCDSISKTGSNIRAVHGIPSTLVNQNDNVDILYYMLNDNYQGYWNIDNDVNSWPLSKTSERLLLGWGNDERYVKGNNALYIVMASEAINRFDNYQKSKEFIIIADAFGSDTLMKEVALRKALEELDFNIDAWYSLIELYKSDDTKTDEDYYNLAQEMSSSLLAFPLAYHDLMTELESEFTSSTYKFKHSLLLINTLKKASNYNDNDVLQPEITNEEAKYLLKEVDSTLATFSFDGEDASKIVLSSRLDDYDIKWDYSLDGKNTWKEVEFSSEEDHKWLLSDEEVNSITAENDIYIHIVGENYDEENLYKIDIQHSKTISGIYNNDLEDKIFGATDNLEWRIHGSDEWTSFKDSKPDLTGNKVIYIRSKKTGIYLNDNAVRFVFTENNTSEYKKYIPISRLSIDAFSSEEKDNELAKNSIDGNINTIWSTTLNKEDTDRYIVLKIDKPVYLSALDYYPSTDGNGRVTDAKILVSTDGKEWTEVVSNTNWDNNATFETIVFDNPVKAKYVKFIGTEISSENDIDYMTASMFNLYEDTTSIEVPTAVITASEDKLTNKDVVLTLVPSTDIKITSSDNWVKDKKENKYTLVVTENKKVDVTFESLDGISGSTTYEVDNIDKKKPTVDITSSSEESSENTVLTLVPSEEIVITNNDKWVKDESENKYTLTVTENGKYKVSFKDEAGNTGSASINIDWIVKNTDKQDDNKVENNNKESNNDKEKDNSVSNDKESNKNDSLTPNEPSKDVSDAKPNTESSNNKSDSTIKDNNKNNASEEIKDSKKETFNFIDQWLDDEITIPEVFVAGIIMLVMAYLATILTRRH